MRTVNSLMVPAKVKKNIKIWGNGDPLGFFNIYSVAKYQKNLEVTLDLLNDSSEVQTDKTGRGLTLW